MSQAVLISIHPQWCALIASGEKTLEVRLSRPKQDTPFKCYIYCTKDKKKQFWAAPRYFYVDDHSHNLFDRCGNGKVIGEYSCDSITSFGVPYPAFMANMDKDIMETSSLSYWQLHRYAYHDTLHGWHISNLKIYGQFKELKEFKQCHKCEYHKNCLEHEYSCDGVYALNRPPQSWCYVEEAT